MGRLDGKVVLISGVARGQGRAEAVRLAGEGADIVGFDIVDQIPSVSYDLADQQDLDETIHLVEATGRRMLARRADTRDRPAVQAIVDEALSELGRIDAVVANAGIAQAGSPYWHIPPDAWNDILSVNLTGVWNTVSAVTPHMVEHRRGSIIVTASRGGLRASPGTAAYIASKHGVVGLMRVIAIELASHHIRANAICPTTVNTPMMRNERLYRRMRPDLESPTLEDAQSGLTRSNAIPEPWVEADDIASVVVWLASDESWYVTGAAIPLDLGSTIKW